ncbi:MAG: phage tail tape measure protein [Bacteroidaceae bacterium]|nr:phage tail tape measure protein [Bacteroidaceae bacterium]
MATQNKNIRRGIELYIDGKEVKNDIRAIETEARKLNKDIKSMTRGSEEYNRTAEKLRQYNTILRQHRNEIKGVEQQQRSWLSKGVQWFKDYSLQICGAIAAITQVSIKLNAFRQQAAEKEDAAANLKALTGLDDNNIAWLTKQAEILSTTMDKSGLRVRKSATEILEAYMLVGSAKPELLQDKQALNAVTVEAMRLAEAAKMDLREAVNAVTTSLNQYSAGADKAARFTNVLAAGSKFGAANVQDQAAAVVKAGVAASSAGVSFEQLVGVIEMLGEKGIKAEEAGTALKRFFLKLQTDADDTNPAIVGLDKALENLAAKHLSMGELQKMFGDRAINVAKILIDNTEKVRNYTQAVTDTNVATEQAAINSDTTAAKMAQIRNQINLTGQELAKTLAPIFSQMVGWSRKFVMAMPAMIDFLKKYGVQLALLAVAYNALAIKNAIATTVQASWNAAVSLGRGVAGGFRAVLLLLHAGYTLLTKGWLPLRLKWQHLMLP